MTIFRFKKLALLGFALLAGCGDVMNSANSSICTTPPSLEVTGSGASTLGEQLDVTKSCVHRWAYRLAGAKGPNLEIAKAAVGGCRDALTHERTLYLQGKKEPFTLEDVNSLKSELDEEYLEMALFHVVQARAGNCKAS